MWKIEGEHLTGVTTASYVTALDWSGPELREKSLHLKNTHLSASMYYKVLANYHNDQVAGNEDEIVGETSLSAGEDVRLTLNNLYNRIYILVKQNSGPGTYELNYIGQGA